MTTLPGNETTTHRYYDPLGRLAFCVENDRLVGSNGLFFGNDPLGYVLPVTLCQIILAIAASRLLFFVLSPLRTPLSICNVLGGIVMGPSLFGRSNKLMGLLYPPRQAEFLSTAAALSAVFFVFTASLKMDIATTLRAAKGSWRFGLIPFLCSFWAALSLFSLFGPESFSGLDFKRGRLTMSIMFSFSNFPVVSQALAELNLLTSELGQIALSSSMLNDFTQWFILSAFSIMKRRNSKASIELLFFFWVLIFFCVFVVRPAMIVISRRTPPGKPVKESYIVMILVGVLVMAAITDSVGINYLHGPLLLGIVMPNGPPLGSTLIDKTEAIISQILYPLLYVFLGINTDVSLIANWNQVLKLQFIVITSCLAKLLGCVLTSLTYKIKPRHGLMLGLILNIKGIVEFIRFDRWRILQIVNLTIFSHLVISSVVMTAILTPLIEILSKPHTRLHLLHNHREMKMIQNNPADSELCILCCVHNESNVRSIIALLEACNPTRSSPICIYVVHLIELVGQSTPFLLHVDEHRKKSMSDNYPNTSPIMRAFDNYSSNTHGPVTIQPYINVAPYKNMHEAICNLAQDNFVPFLIIPFHENEQIPGSLIATAIRGLNVSLQAYAPCTVGILVDRYSQLRMVGSDFIFHVGIFFIGGFDDREALALASRMSERADVRVTLFRFLLQTKQMGVGKSEIFESKEAQEEEEEDEEAKIQGMLDKCYIDEFKAKNVGNSNVACHNILVEDAVHVVEAIRALEGNYDLVMVGRRHDMEGLRDEEMLNFIENAELLGTFGDMLASTEFCNGLVSVLVTQCGVKQPNCGLQSKSSVHGSSRFQGP